MVQNVEFYLSPDGSINIHRKGEPTQQFTEACTDIVEEVLLMVRDLYPEAHAALAEIYSASSRNKKFFEYKIVHRFIRCNFGEYDGLTFDIDGMGNFNFEHVACPLRGECKHEGIICRPRMKTDLTDKENEVATLLIRGYDRYAIADELKISPYTVTRHLANIRHRLGLKSSSQIITHLANATK